MCEKYLIGFVLSVMFICFRNYYSSGNTSYRNKTCLFTDFKFCAIFLHWFTWSFVCIGSWYVCSFYSKGALLICCVERFSCITLGNFPPFALTSWLARYRDIKECMVDYEKSVCYIWDTNPLRNFRRCLNDGYLLKIIEVGICVYYYFYSLSTLLRTYAVFMFYNNELHLIKFCQIRP